MLYLSLVRKGMDVHKYVTLSNCTQIGSNLSSTCLTNNLHVGNGNLHKAFIF
jgi:ArsR family metal-binding transcriptional regulator